VFVINYEGIRMSDSRLTIPDAASEAGAFAARPYVTDSYCDLAPAIVRDVLDAAAPLIVTAELRRLVAELEAIQAQMWATDGDVLGEGIRLIRDRADALEGGV